MGGGRPRVLLAGASKNSRGVLFALRGAAPFHPDRTSTVRLSRVSKCLCRGQARSHESPSGINKLRIRNSPLFGQKEKSRDCRHRRRLCSYSGSDERASSRGKTSPVTGFRTSMTMFVLCIVLMLSRSAAMEGDTFNPTQAPTFDPSRGYSISPSSANSPSASPTRAPNSIPQRFKAEMGMDMGNCTTLTEESITVWQSITASFIFESFLLRVEEDLLQLNVTVEIIDQQPLPIARRLISHSFSSTGTHTLRREQALQTLRVFFDVSVSFRSSPFDVAVEQWVWDAFGTSDQRALYIFALKNTGDAAFTYVEGVTIYPRNLLEDVSTRQDVPEEENFTLVIVAAVLGSLSALTLVGLLLYLRHSSRSAKAEQERERASPSEVNGVNPDQVVSTLVVTSNQIDADAVSTLGGSVMSHSIAEVAGSVDTTLQEAFDYDHEKEIRRAGGNVADKNISVEESAHDTSISQGGESSFDGSGLDGSGLVSKLPSVVADDASFELQYRTNDDGTTFQIAAPPGKLGVIIDTPENSPPTVFAIKDTSPIAGAVTVGDQLVSVDGIDTTEMTSVVVSQLLFDKAKNPTRILAFQRVLGIG